MDYYGYILQRSGPRHSATPLHERAGTRLQTLGIANAFLSRSIAGKQVLLDHVRRSSGPESFPSLFGLLESAERDRREIEVSIHDIGRLLRHQRIEGVLSTAELLLHHGDRIFDTCQMRRLSELGGGAFEAIIRQNRSDAMTGKISRQCGRDAAIGRSTAAARRVSCISRKFAASKAAAPIGDLFDELSGKGVAPRHSELARLANDRGLRTSRGGAWSNVAVRRALERLGKLPG